MGSSIALLVYDCHGDIELSCEEKTLNVFFFKFDVRCEVGFGRCHYLFDSTLVFVRLLGSIHFFFYCLLKF